MTIAYWCILLSVFIPLGCAYYGKLRGGFQRRDNANPRAFWASTEGVAARANAAQANSHEIFAPFAAAVLIAHATGQASQGWVDALAVLFVLSRIGYCVAYVADQSSLRSLLWVVGLLCIMGLFVAAA